jgi:hypothetical protein
VYDEKVTCEKLMCNIFSIYPNIHVPKQEMHAIFLNMFHRNKKFSLFKCNFYSNSIVCISNQVMQYLDGRTGNFN